MIFSVRGYPGRLTAAPEATCADNFRSEQAPGRLTKGRQGNFRSEPAHPRGDGPPADRCCADRRRTLEAGSDSSTPYRSDRLPAMRFGRSGASRLLRRSDCCRSGVRVFKDLDADDRHLIAVHNPLSVAASLGRASGNGSGDIARPLVRIHRSVNQIAAGAGNVVWPGRRD